MKIFKKIKCLIGLHNYINLDAFLRIYIGRDYDKDREKYLYFRCNICGKTRAEKI